MVRGFLLLFLVAFIEVRQGILAAEDGREKVVFWGFGLRQSWFAEIGKLAVQDDFLLQFVNLDDYAVVRAVVKGYLADRPDVEAVLYHDFEHPIEFVLDPTEVECPTAGFTGNFAMDADVAIPLIADKYLGQNFFFCLIEHSDPAELLIFRSKEFLEVG